MQNTPASCNLPVSHPEISALAGQILSGRKSEQTNAAGITPSDTDSGIGSRFLLQQSGLQQCNWIKTSLLVLHIARRIWLCGGQQQPPLFEFQYCLGCLCSAKGTWFPNRNLGIFSPKKKQAHPLLYKMLPRQQWLWNHFCHRLVHTDFSNIFPTGNNPQ